ncbi:MAG: serine hydrolase [Solirubrobacteraceae bacterium]
MSGRPRWFAKREAWWRGLLALATSCVIAACGSAHHGPSRSVAKPASTSTTAPAAVPGTPAGAQLRWLLGAVGRPIPDTVVRAHFDPSFLAVFSPATVSGALTSVGELHLVSVTTSRARSLVVVVTMGTSQRLRVSLAVDAQGLISGLLLRAPVPPAPTSWAGVDRAARSVAPKARLLVAEATNGTCRPIHVIDAGTPAPVASVFKLYVLDALAKAIAAGKVTWDEKLTVTDRVRSFSSETLQGKPDGTRMSVRDVADAMISVSDNTATDMLIARLGRRAVEAALRTTKMADPSLDTPFLTTRETFTLALHDWPKLASRYLALGTAGRRALLASTIDRVPLASLDPSSLSTPRAFNSIGWFASASVICRVYTSLAKLARRPGLAGIAHALGIDDGGLDLNRRQWQSVWFKGGWGGKCPDLCLPGNESHRPYLRGDRAHPKSLRADR